MIAADCSLNLRRSGQDEKDDVRLFGHALRVVCAGGPEFLCTLYRAWINVTHDYAVARFYEGRCDEAAHRPDTDESDSHIGLLALKMLDISVTSSSSK